MGLHAMVRRFPVVTRSVIRLSGHGNGPAIIASRHDCWLRALHRHARLRAGGTSIVGKHWAARHRTPMIAVTKSKATPSRQCVERVRFRASHRRTTCRYQTGQCKNVYVMRAFHAFSFLKCHSANSICWRSGAVWFPSLVWTMRIVPSATDRLRRL